MRYIFNDDDKSLTIDSLLWDDEKNLHKIKLVWSHVQLIILCMLLLYV